MNCTIARKKHSVGLLYIALTVFGGVFAIGSFIGIHQTAGIISSVVTVICAVLSAKFLSLPSDIVVLTDEHTIALPKGIRIPLTAIVDVSYRKARAKGIKYAWGKITISTFSDSYSYHFVCDCEEAAKRLMNLVEAEKGNRRVFDLPIPQDGKIQNNICAVFVKPLDILPDLL